MAYSYLCFPRLQWVNLVSEMWFFYFSRLFSMDFHWHYSDVIISTMASEITSPTIVYSTVYSGADQRKHQSSASLAFVRGIHRRPGNSPHKGPVTRKMFPMDDVIMKMRIVGYPTLYHIEIVCYYAGLNGFNKLPAHHDQHKYKYLIFLYPLGRQYCACNKWACKFPGLVMWVV